MKIYRHGDTYIAPRGSFFDGNVKIDGNFITPPDTHIWGNIIVAGCLELGPYSTVGGYVKAGRVVIGHDARIKGPLSVLETATVCDNAHLHSIQAGGKHHPQAGCQGRRCQQRRDDLRLRQGRERPVIRQGRESLRDLTGARCRAGRHPSPRSSLQPSPRTRP